MQTRALLLTVASLAVVLGAQPEDVKDDAAAARHHRHRPGRFGHGGHGGPRGYPFYQPLVQDRFVCDLDASVLLVVDSHRPHHRRNPFIPTGANRAVRVKCSEVANINDETCNLCCQQTARRDTTLANDKLFGFLAITKIEDDITFSRTKRAIEEDEEEAIEDEEEEDEEEGSDRRRGFNHVEPTYVVEQNWTPAKYNTNVKCVCCAPRSTTTVAAQNPTTYSQPQTVAAASPSAAAASPLVDTWQSDSAGTWGAAADATAAPGNTY